jgi:hypothetical protein
MKPVFKCDYCTEMGTEWGKIINDKSAAEPGHAVVHTCSKCDKRKTTKVNI